MRIAIIEDNKPLSDGIAVAFKSDGHGVDQLFDGNAAEDFLSSEITDLVILDINLPQKSGLEVLKGLRSRKVQTPVLLLTARDALDDKIKGLDLGADDYLTKPFDLAELKARARALMRRSDRQIQKTISTGRLIFDIASRSVQFNGIELDLPRREYALAEFLVQNKGRILSKTQILDHLYGAGAEIDEATVELYIHRLRKRIVDSGVEIKTARGLGYCLREVE